MWWQLELGWLFLAGHIVNMFHFYSYSQIVCEDCLAFMIVCVTKTIQSVLQAHSGQYMTGNYSLNMYKLFVCWSCWRGWLPQPCYIVHTPDDFSNCPEEHESKIGGQEHAVWIRGTNLAGPEKSEQVFDLKLFFCPHIHAEGFCISCACSQNNKMFHFIWMVLTTNHLCMFSPGCLRNYLRNCPRKPIGFFPSKVGWRIKDWPQQITVIES